MTLEEALKLPDGVHLNVPAEVYHLLPYESSTFIKKFRNNPAEAIMPFEMSNAMILGHASHVYSLEGEEAFCKLYAVAPEFPCPAGQNPRGWKSTNNYKNMVADFQSENQDKQILDSEQWKTILNINNSLSAHPVVQQMLCKGEQEVTIIWTDKDTGLRCKARLDWNPGKKVLIDYKTTASIERFINQIVALNYDIQAAHYSMGAIECGIEVDYFIFIVVQVSEPYPVRCGYLEDDWLSWAKIETKRLLGLIKECKEKKYFPAFNIPQHIVSLDQMQPWDLLEIFEMPKWR